MSSILMTVIISINNLAGILIAIRFSGAMIQHNRLRKSWRVLIVFGIVILSVFLNRIVDNAFVLIFMDFLINMLVVYLLFIAEFHLKIIISIFLVVFALIAEFLTATIFSNVWDQTIHNMTNESTLFMSGGFISSMIFLMMIEIVIRYMSKSNFLVSVKSWLLIISIPLVSIYLACISIYKSIIDNSLDNTSLVICIAIIYINLITFYLFDHIVAQIEENNQYRLREEQMLLEREQYKNIMSAYDQVRKVRHDMANHLIVIDRYLQEQTYDQVKEYIDKLSDEIGFSEKSILSNNIVVDALLNNKLVIGKNLGIKMHYNIIIPSRFNIDDMDICTLLGNILNNAIEGCERVKSPKINKSIYVTMSYKNNHLLISVINPYNKKSIKHENGQFLSSKGLRDGHYYGLGIANVESIVNKYGGVLNTELVGNTFTIKVMLPDKIPWIVTDM